jgi:hypothetical protein
MNPSEFVNKVAAPPGGCSTRFASSAAIALATLLAACGLDDPRTAGKGVITETTNSPAARGRLATSDSTPISTGTVRVVIDEDVPESWNGKSRAVAVVASNGEFRLTGLDKPAFLLLAKAIDAKGRTRTGLSTFSVAGQDEIILPEIVITAPASLGGRFERYDSVAATLNGDWRLRAKVRGLGAEVFLDSTGRWNCDSVPAGRYRVRIEKVDGTPGHETTLWDSTLTAG